MTNFKSLFPQWTLTINEVSNNVYQFNASSKLGNQAELTDSDYDAGLKRIIEDTFDLEWQICKEPNKLIFDICLSQLDSHSIIEKRYEPTSFGSWIIQLKNRRIILDGKDSVLNLDKKSGILATHWTNERSLQLKDGLSYADLELFLDRV